MSNADLVYQQIVNMLGGAFSTTVGTRSEAWIYATAQALGDFRDKKDACAAQMVPGTVTDMIPVRESTYGVIPGRLDTIADRQAALVGRYVLPQGAKLTAVNAALTAAIGSDFLYYRTTKTSEIATFPASPAASGIFQRVVTPPRLVRVSRVFNIGSAINVNYSQFDPHGNVKVVAGDKLVVSINNIGLAETVTVLSATATTFNAVFTKSHDDLDIATLGDFPYWKSTQCHVTIVVTPAAAHDPEKKRKVNGVMSEISRGWITWDICPSTNGTSTDSFAVGNATRGRIGYAGIGSHTFP